MKVKTDYDLGINANNSENRQNTRIRNIWKDLEGFRNMGRKSNENPLGKM